MDDNDSNRSKDHMNDLKEVMERLSTLSDRIAVLTTETKLVTRELIELKEKANENHRTLRGNNGQDGLVAQVRGLRRDLDGLVVGVGTCNRLLTGEDGEKGLVDKVRDFESFRESLNKWLAVIGGFIVVDILSRVLPRVYEVLAAGLN